MITISTYNILTLPDVSAYFETDYLSGRAKRPVAVGDKVLFLLLKAEKEGERSLVHTTGRVDIGAAWQENGGLRMELRPRPETDDLSAQERGERFDRMRAALLDVLNGAPQLAPIRGYVMRWQNMNELMAYSSAFLRLSPEEKFEIVAEDSAAKRAERMERAFYESLAQFQVNREAREAQKESNEQAYREQALRRQIGFLQ